MKVFQTNKLYYGKWAYRIELKTYGASFLRYWGLEKTKLFCTGSTLDASAGNSRTVHINKPTLLQFVNDVEPYLNIGLKLRVEHDTITMYLNDPVQFEEIKKELAYWVKSISAPANDTELATLQEKSAQVLCNKLPQSKFKHRVYIRPAFPEHQRASFLKWLDNYPETIQASKTTLQWLDGKGRRFYQGPFLYVHDKSHLLLVSLFLGKYVKRAEEFVLRDT
jgi:hypothetical protein